MTEKESAPTGPLGCLGLAFLIVAILGAVAGYLWKGAGATAKTEPLRIPATTAAEMAPCSAATKGGFYFVTDAASPYDCTLGGGRWTLVCFCDGESYVPLYREGAR